MAHTVVLWSTLPVPCWIVVRRQDGPLYTTETDAWREAGRLAPQAKEAA